MDSAETLLALIEHLYAAPGSEAGWREFLIALCTALDGASISFMSHNLVNRKSSVTLTARGDPQMFQDYVQHWAAVDPWASNSAARRLSAGAVVTGEQLISLSALKRTAFYNEFSRHYEITGCLAGVVESSSQVLSGIAINAAEQRSAFGREDVTLLSALMTHVRRALQVHRRILTAEGNAARSVAVLDQLSNGVLVLDHTGRVVFANNLAENLLRQRDGLVLDKRELRCGCDADTARLRALCKSALECSQASGLGSGGALSVGRPSGRTPLRLVVAPIASNWIDGVPESAAAVVFISNPGEALPPSDALRAIFGLSPAETRVAHEFLTGDRMDTIADRLHVSRNTIRTHLAHLFAKTNTKRQAELIRVLLSVTGPPGRS